jgi:magnesium and cobalt transporter
MDLFRRGAEASALSDLMRPATYVPETKRIDDLLREMQKARIQLAVVVDEYGGSVGIATVEDIIEEIVGEIQDEHDRRPTTLEPLPDGSYLAAGRTTVEAINEELDWNLPKGEYETLGGLILSSLHRIPVRGEEVTIGGHHLTVVEADERRIVKVRLSPRRYARGENRSSITGRER